MRIRIPQNQMSLPRSSGAAPVNPQALAANGIGEVANAAKQFLVAEQNTMNTLALGEAGIGVQADLAALRTSLSTAPLNEVEDLYAAGSKEIYNTRTEGMNPAVRRQFEQDFAQHNANALIAVRSDRRDRVISTAKAMYLNIRKDTLSHMATLSPLGAEFAHSQNMLSEQISGLVHAGAMTVEQGEKELQSVFSDIDEVKVRQQMRADPLLAEELLADPKMFPHLDSLARERLATQASNLADAKREEAVRDAEDREQAEQEALEAKQDAREIEIMGRLLQLESGQDPGEVPTVDQIVEMQSNQELSPEGAARLLRLRNQEVTPQDDLVFLQITEAIYDVQRLGFAERQQAVAQIERDLRSALARGKVTSSDYSTLRSRLEQSLSQGFDEVASARRYIRQAFGVDDSGGFMARFEENDFAKQIAPLFGEALREYEARVNDAMVAGQGGQDAPTPFSIAADIVQRTVGAKLDAHSIPAPRFGAKDEFGMYVSPTDYTAAQVHDAYSATAEALAKGQLSSEQAFIERERLHRLHMYVRIRDAQPTGGTGLPSANMDDYK